jgi:hypothetical protein
MKFTLQHQLTDLAGTNPIHNKKPKKAKGEDTEEDLEHKKRLAAGKSLKHVVMIY